MKSFLTEVAEQLYAKYGDELSTLTILFPSQRARLFFTEALTSICAKPIWSPRFTTIDELMGQISCLRSADRLRLNAELYNIYKQYHNEDFDRFYHWGEMLIADFDMIDKYQVDAKLLFANIADLKQIDADIDYLKELTEEQKQCLNQFWNILNSRHSFNEHKEYFLKIWRSLYTIYDQYKSHLRSLRIGYSGMIYRDAAERIESASEQLLPQGRYAVVGFNALSACEKRLFDYLKSCHDADFFWDYSDYYLSDEQEAGRFIRENIKRYPSSMPVSHTDLQQSVSSLTVASTTTSVSQCHYVVQVLKELAEKSGKDIKLDKETAIVLTDENMLMPLLYTLPVEFKGGDEQGSGINVTMGYPLRQSVAYSFIERLLELQNHAHSGEDGVTFYHADVVSIITHPYLIGLVDNKVVAAIKSSIVDKYIYNVPVESLAHLPYASVLFTTTHSAEELIAYLDAVISYVAEIVADDKMQIEMLIQSRQSIVQLGNLVKECKIELPLSLCRSLIRRHLQSVRVPFEGEPLKGVQIMGILETRNLDFKNVIVLSMSDNNFPGTRITDSSFIPYNLRYAYGLPTREHHEGVYAYYFYRLIQRAENVWLVYPAVADEKGSGEQSRYIRQLEFESNININTLKVAMNINVLHHNSFSVPKDSRCFEELEKYTTGEKKLSPTAFSTYVKCPMKFFFHYIAHIKEENRLEEELDNKGFGIIFHSAAEYLYEDLLVKKTNPKSILEGITEEKITGFVNRAISKERYGGAPFNEDMLKGEMSVVQQIVIKYIKNNLLPYDIAHPNFVTLKVEDIFLHPFEFEVNGVKRTVILEGRADRVDSLDNGLLRIIDYKTGSEHLDYSSIQELFGGSDDKRVSNTINTLMYAMIATKSGNRKVQPALYYLRSMHDVGYSPLLYNKIGSGANVKRVNIECYDDVAAEFEHYIYDTLCKIYDPELPFTQAEDSKACTFCAYLPICARKVKKPF